MSNITDALPISLKDLKQYIKIPDYQNTVVLRSRNSVCNVSYNTNASVYNKYVTVDVPNKGSDGYNTVVTSADKYTRTLTAKTDCILIVTDGSNPVGIKQNNTSSFVSIPIGTESLPGTVQLQLSVGDKVIIRSGSSEGELDPLVVVCIPYK